MQHYALQILYSDIRICCITVEERSVSLEEFCRLSLVARARGRSQRVELTVSLLFYLLPNQWFTETAEGGRRFVLLLCVMCSCPAVCLFESAKVCSTLCSHLSTFRACQAQDGYICVCVCACAHARCAYVRTIRKWTFIFLADWFSGAFFNGFVFRCWAASSYIFHDILCSSCQHYFSSFHLPETSISYLNCLCSSLLHHSLSIGLCSFCPEAEHFVLNEVLTVVQ